MSTLKMVLLAVKTLKTTIKQNLTKSQKFARKISVAEFRDSQTIFLRFTVISLMIMKLVHFKTHSQHTMSSSNPLVGQMYTVSIDPRSELL